MGKRDTTTTLDRRTAQPFGPGTLDEILKLSTFTDGVLSVYLDIDPAEAQREGFEAALLDLWKPLRSEWRDSDLAPRLEQEIDQVNEYVRSWAEPPGRAVAIFSSGPHHLFMPVALSVTVLAGAQFGTSAHVLPLIAALDEHGPYRVALVDRERARLLSVWMERIQQRIEFKDSLPGRVTGGGGWAAGAPSGGGTPGSRIGQGIAHSSQGGYARHIDALVHRHIERVIAELWRLARTEGAGRIVIGGLPEAVAMMREMLPRSLAQYVVGIFPGEFYASDSDVLDRVRRIEEQAERLHEDQLVESVIERALKGELAAIGWDDTLTALSEGRAHTVILIEGERRGGSVCPSGHLAVVERIERCPYCGEAMSEVSDLAVWALRRAFATDAGVEFVRGDAAGKLRVHGAAATLRY